MSEGKKIRLSKVLKEFNISMVTAVEYLKKEKGIEIESNPNTSITEDIVKFLSNKFNADKSKREVSKEIVEDKRKEREAIRTNDLTSFFDCMIGRNQLLTCLDINPVETWIS